MDSSFPAQEASGLSKVHRKLFNDLTNMHPHDVDALFHGAHESVFEQTNCLSCANCCKTTPALITSEDSNRIAAHLKLKPSIFRQRYVRIDEDGDEVINSSPCPFLMNDNSCSIYDIRPRACKEYPHTDRRKMKQILDITWENRSVCPAVLDIVEMIRTTLD
jgi:uncharacterized protein